MDYAPLTKWHEENLHLIQTLNPPRYFEDSIKYPEVTTCDAFIDDSDKALLPFLNLWKTDGCLYIGDYSLHWHGEEDYILVTLDHLYTAFLQMGGNKEIIPSPDWLEVAILLSAYVRCKHFELSKGLNGERVFTIHKKFLSFHTFDKSSGRQAKLDAHVMLPSLMLIGQPRHS